MIAMFDAAWRRLTRGAVTPAAAVVVALLLVAALSACSAATPEPTPVAEAAGPVASLARGLAAAAVVSV